MIFKPTYFAAALLGALIITVPGRAAAQSPALTDDYALIKEASPWLSSGNPAGIHAHLDSARISTSSIFAGLSSGEFRDYDEAAKVSFYGAGAESFYRISRRLSFFGGVEYQSRSYRDVAGSAFIDPEGKPFDLVEYEPHDGKAALNRYALKGAFSFQAGKMLSLGVKMDYIAADYAKYRDLRHKNSLMDLSLGAGAHLRLSDKFQAGFDLRYRRSSESLNFGIYGTADRTYRTLISYGAFMGRTEAFGESGYTEKSRDIPFFDKYTGFGLQLQWEPVEGLSLYGEFVSLKREGYYGKKSSYTVSLNEHDGSLQDIFLRADYRRGGVLHRFEAGRSSYGIDDFSNTYREVEDENSSARYYEYYTPVKRSHKRSSTLRAVYTLQTGFKGVTPAWILSLGAFSCKTGDSAFEYPFFRRQSLSGEEFSGGVERNFIRKTSIIGVRLSILYAKGSGEPFTDGYYAAPAAGQTRPGSMDEYLYRNYEFLTAPQIRARIGGRYTFTLPATGLKPYIDLDVTISHASGLEHICTGGASRLSAILTLGTAF